MNIDIHQNTTAGIVLQTILPLYAGTSISNEFANIAISTKNNANYRVKFEWTNLLNSDPQSLYILPEATAILAIGSTPNHIVSIIEGKNNLTINGHSVMMGYLDDRENSKVFKSGSLIIQR